MQYILVLFLILHALPIQAKHLYTEKQYQNFWCSKHKGQPEVMLRNGTRADCLTETQAVEIDFAPKWQECLGQAINYSAQTNKQAVCVLILEKEKDEKYVNKLDYARRKKEVSLWIRKITPQQLEKYYN